MDAMNVSVILPAAGSGTRFAQGSGRSGPGLAGGLSKIEMELAGKPVFLHAVESFIRRADVGQVIVAVAPDKLDDFRFRWGDKLAFLDVEVVAGGVTDRWQTVLRALDAVSSDATHIAVHDAARPLASEALIDRVFDAAKRFPAVIPGCDVGATLKRVGVDDTIRADADPLDAILGTSDKDEPPIRRVVKTVDRRNLIAVQTPQVFEAVLFRRAYLQFADGGPDSQGITDDAQLIEAMGEPVRVVEGETTNLKITYPGDAELAEALLSKRGASRAADLAKKKLFRYDDEL
ncbi:MAG: 2-C-methyl-D-erythritol 4-phosphate cytidylyltransferase [Phycisphaerales bacterium]